MNAVAAILWMSDDSETDFRSLFGNAPFGIVRCQRSGNITGMNSALEQVVGSLTHLKLPLRLIDVMNPKDRAEAEILLYELFGGSRECFQLDAPSPDGSTIRWTAWKVPASDGAGDCVYAIAETPGQTPLDSRLRAERLEAVGRLAGGVAHDFNNLVTGVLLYCDLLLATLEPQHRARKYAEEIRKAGLQTTGLVRQLLAVARPGKSEPCLLSLNEMAESMSKLLVRLIREDIQLELHTDPELGLVRIDPTQAQQILLNLVLNSRDALPTGGHITVETRNCKIDVIAPTRLSAGQKSSLPCVLLAVEDDGCGMDAHTRDHMFDPFFTTKGGKGTGLGLSTVHDIVVKNGGLIHVESERGRGTRVSVLLPQVFASGPEANKFDPAPGGEADSHAILTAKEEE